jgi:dihydroflavonol-4-reductase
VRRAIRGFDVLYHLAGAVDYSRRNRARTWDVNVLGTRNVIEAALANGIGTVVYASSVSVLGAPAAGRPIADEDNDRYAPGLNPISFANADAARDAVDASLRGDYRFLSRMRVPYFDSKLAAFELVMERARRTDARLIVTLPGTAVGAGDVGLSLGGLVQRVADGRMAFTLPGGTSFVSAPDIAVGMRLAAAHGRNGEAYILTGADTDNLSYAEFMAMVARVARRFFGKTPAERYVTVPSLMARFIARLAEGISPRAALTSGLAISGSMTHRFSSRKAHRELGFSPLVPLEESVRACIAFNLEMMRRTRQ